MKQEELDLLKQTFATQDQVDELKKAGKDAGQDPKKIEEFLNHLQQCATDDCEIHRAKDDIETKAFALGYLTRDQID